MNYELFKTPEKKYRMKTSVHGWPKQEGFNSEKQNV